MYPNNSGWILLIVILFIPVCRFSLMVLGSIFPGLSELDSPKQFSIIAIAWAILTFVAYELIKWLST